MRSLESHPRLVPIDVTLGEWLDCPNPVRPGRGDNWGWDAIMGTKWDMTPQELRGLRVYVDKTVYSAMRLYRDRGGYAGLNVIEFLDKFIAE